MIGLVTALPSEAGPLAEAFELAPDRAGSFRARVGEGMGLVVSGVGMPAASEATHALWRRMGEPRDAAWLNVGVAGHRDAAVGAPFLAHRVERVVDGAVWYPPVVFPPPCATAPIKTVERVELDLADGALYEMEAAGFLSAALEHSTGELVQVVKVVSDNLRTGTAGLSAASVRDLIESRLDVVTRLVEALRGLAASLHADCEVASAEDRVRRGRRFTVTQRRQLRRLLERLQALGGAPSGEGRWEESRDARSVLRALRAEVRRLSPWEG